MKLGIMGWGDVAVFDDLLDPKNIDGKHLAVDEKGQVLGIALVIRG